MLITHCPITVIAKTINNRKLLDEIDYEFIDLDGILKARIAIFVFNAFEYI